MKTFCRIGFICFCRQSFFFIGFCLVVGNSIPTAFAYVSPFVQRTWQSDQGLPYDSVQAIVQTRDGYLWLGTRRGVARFDGATFTSLEIPGASRENISSLHEDNNGVLWIGTARGIARLKDGIVTRFGPAEGVPDDDVRAIYEARDGSLWFGRTGGLTHLTNGKFQNFTRAEGLPNNVVRCAIEDGLGHLWIGTDGGLARMKEGVISVFETPAEFGRYIRLVFFDPEKNMWIGTQTGLFRRKENGWEHFSKMKSGLSDDFIDAIYCDRNGQLWIGTYGGLNRFVDGKLVTELTSEGTAFDLVNCIFEDREGSFWIGSKEGVTRLKTRPFTAITKQQGLTYNNVMSVLEDRNGNLWAGTWGGGAFQFQGEKTTAVFNQMANNRVLSICEARDGSLWFGTDFDSGLYRLKDGVLTREAQGSGLETIGIRVIQEDREGNFWIGTARSLAMLKDGKCTHFTPKDGLAGELVRVILESEEGDLWVGTWTGLSQRKNGKFTNFTTKDGLSNDTIHALYEDKEGNLWIGTGGGGLNRLRHGKFTSYLTKDGLFNDEVLEILEDDFGDLWMSSLKGIFRVSKKSLDKFDRGEIDSIPCASYGKEDGMVSIICGNVSKPGAWKARDGRLWFATTKGLVIADPKIKINDLPPPVVIEEVFADKKVQSLKSKVQSPDQRASSTFNLEPGTLNFPPGRGELEFHYAALSFQEPERNRFKYKLEGVDLDWVDAGTRREAYYNNIAPGHYTFRVMACNNDGVWNSLGSNVKFTLLPHFWQTKWFFALAGLVATGFIAGTARYVTWKRVQRELDRLEQQHAVEKERTRIAQDMHDDLGARLTEILLLNTRAQKSQSKEEQSEAQAAIAEATEDIAQNLDAIVWAVSPKNDSLDKATLYLCSYMEKYLSKSSIRCRLEMDDTPPDIPVSSEARHNLFLSVKEAANNIVKHSNASEVWFRVRWNDSRLSLSIEDNGRGFSTGSNSEFGNGLQNREARMKSSGGKFALESAPGKGTSVRLQIPLNRAANHTAGGVSEMKIESRLR